VPLIVNIIVPPGAVALPLVSVTVAVHVEFWVTTTGVEHATVVVVG